MGKIPTNFESVGVSQQASVNLDVDALTREAVIKLFELKDENGNDIDPYDDKYYEFGISEGSDSTGAQTLIRTFIITEGKILSFVFAQFLYIVSPIKIGLELPSYVAQPPKLVQKIKLVLEDIKKMIEDMILFLTDTPVWFTNLLLSPLEEINIPIPDFDLSLIGFNIPIASIDPNNRFEEPAFIENLTDFVKDTKDNIKGLNDKFQTLLDSSNPTINNIQLGLVAAIAAVITVLYYTLYQESITFIDLIYQMHEQFEKKVKVSYEKYTQTKNGYLLKDSSYDKDFKYVNNGAEIDKVVRSLREIFNKIEKKKPITESEKKEMLTMADTLMELVDDEEESITETIDYNQFRKDENFDNTIKNIDSDIYDIYLELRESRISIEEIIAEIEDNDNKSDTVKDSIGDFIDGNVDDLKNSLIEEIANLKDQIADLSPASIWKEQIIGLIMGIIKAPVDFIMELLKMLLDGVIEFLTSIPIPTFDKIIEFFKELVSLPNVDKMTETLTKLISKIIPSIEPDDQTLKNVMKVLPWLVTTVALEFVTSIATPLPLPI